MERHEPFTSSQLAHGKQRMLDRWEEANAGGLFYMGDITGQNGHLEVWTTSWPFHDRFRIFVCNPMNGSPVGYALLTEYPNKFIKKLFSISMINFYDQALGKGFGFAFYKFILDKGYRLQADQDHTPASERIWAKLATETGYEVWKLKDDKPYQKLKDTASMYGASGTMVARKS